MSAIQPDEPAQEGSSIDTQQLQQLQQQQQHAQQDIAMGQPMQPPQSVSENTGRKTKAPSVRRACVACHTGKTRCSEVLPCQSCIKRGLASTCAYPDPDAQAQEHANHHTPAPAIQPPFNAPMYTTIQGAPNTLTQHQYYDYNGQFTASTSTFRSNKRPRNLTEEEAAAITRNFTRGDFFVGSSAPVRIDPRLSVRLTLGEGDHVHFTVGEPLV